MKTRGIILFIAVIILYILICGLQEKIKLAGVAVHPEKEHKKCLDVQLNPNLGVRSLLLVDFQVKMGQISRKVEIIIPFSGK